MAKAKKNKKPVLVERHHIPRNHIHYKECDMLCYVAKNLYNSSLYVIRQHFFKTNKFTDGKYIDKNGKEQNQWVYSNTYLYHAMKDSPEFRTNQHAEYNGLSVNTKVLKQVYIQVNQAFSNYFEAKKDYKNNTGKYKGMPGLPNYKKKTGRVTMTFPKDAIGVVKIPGYVTLSGTNICVKLYRANKDNIKQVKIVPLASGYDIVISYEVGEVLTITNHSKYAAIDLGLNNLATLTSNDTCFKPFIVNGRPLKSINQYFNKKKAKITSELPKNIYFSKKLGKLYTKRNHKIRDYMHKASDYIVKQLIQSGITCLIVGSNKHWKTSINIGTRNNQNFVSIPYYKFKNMLRYKCALVGIEFIEHEESYTSKCSFLDMEDICKHVDANGSDCYVGKRVKRGLFRSGTNALINADMNGSYNILRKVAGDDIFVYNDISDLVEGYAVSPSRVTF